MKNATGSMNLIQKALQFEELENLVDAVKWAGLIEVIKSGGPFTVFAPVNGAFLKIPKNVACRVEMEPLLFSQMIQYHVVPGRHYAPDLATVREYRTLIGEPVYISLQNKEQWLNSAKILRRDLEASNGVIHVIDQVLIPDSMTHKEGNAEAFYGASASRIIGGKQAHSPLCQSGGKR